MHLSGAEHEKLKKWALGILSSHPSNSVWFEFISEISDKEGRFVTIKEKIDQKEVTLLNVSFFRKVFDLIASKTYGTIICAGDFNVLLNPILDTTNKERRRNPTERPINRELRDLGLIDVGRSLHGTDPGYTLYSAGGNSLPSNEQIRL